MTHLSFNCKQKGWSKLLWLGLILFISILTLLIARFGIYYSCLFRPMLSSGQAARLLQVEPHTSALKFMMQLKDLNLVSPRCPLLRYMQWYGYTQRLKAGVYQINPGDTPAQLIQHIVAGDVIVKSFKIIEGTTLEDLKHNFSQAPFLQFNE